MKHILLTILLFVPSFCIADDKLPLLLEEETMLVTYVNFAKIDAAELVRNNRPIIEKLLSDTGFYSPEMLQELFPDENQRKAFENTIRDWDAIAQLVGGGKALLSLTFGIDEAYFVLNLRGLGFDVAYVALPKTKRLNVTMLRSSLEATEFRLRETNDFILIGLAEPEDLGPMRLKSRPDFLEARKNVENYPVQILFAVPDFVRKVLADTKPFLREPLNKIDIAKLVGGLRYKAVGIDPVKPELCAVASATSELAAQELYFNGRAIFEIGFQVWEEKKDGYVPDNEIERKFFERVKAISTWDNLERLRDTIIPKPQGTQFTVFWDAPTIRQAVENVTPLVAPMLEGSILGSRQAARRMDCVNKMKTLAIAVHNYHDAQGCLPPPYSADSGGKPLHSWRVLLLPYMEELALYEAIRKDEPWDSEYNKQFHDKMPVVFRCEENKLGYMKSGTTYFMVVGGETFGQPPQQDGKKYTFHRIIDGTSNTIGFVEGKEPVCWMAPVDIPQEIAYQGVNRSDQGIGSFHQTGANCTFIDGSVHFLSNSVDPKTLKALLTIAGGESVSIP
ncbi:MAG: DUF1559 domain-containing protein [Planctomycetaceae bacterium]|nr:DUF1559 domain-containing protein [Planctomycetaceae bacterium]